MAARPRSEPFAERACPLGACDGSGWILGPEDVARPCECREERLKRGRIRGVASAIPPRYRGVSFDRPPVSDMARSAETKAAVDRVREFIDRLDANLKLGKGLWLFGDTGTGKTTLAMLVSKAAIEGGRSVAIYSLPKLLARIRRTYDGEPGEDSYSRVLPAADVRGPAAHRRLRRGEALRLGAGAAVLARQRALRRRTLDPAHHQPRHGQARGADRPPHRLAADRDLRPDPLFRQRPSPRQRA